MRFSAKVLAILASCSVSDAFYVRPPSVKIVSGLRESSTKTQVEEIVESNHENPTPITSQPSQDDFYSYAPRAEDIYENLPPLKMDTRPSSPKSIPSIIDEFENLPRMNLETKPSRKEEKPFTEDILENLPRLDVETKPLRPGSKPKNRNVLENWPRMNLEIKTSNKASVQDAMKNPKLDIAIKPSRPLKKVVIEDVFQKFRMSLETKPSQPLKKASSIDVLDNWPRMDVGIKPSRPLQKAASEDVLDHWPRLDLETKPSRPLQKAASEDVLDHWPRLDLETKPSRPLKNSSSEDVLEHWPRLDLETKPSRPLKKASSIDVLDNWPRLNLGTKPSPPGSGPLRETLMENLPPLNLETKPSRPHKISTSEDILENWPRLNLETKPVASKEKLSNKDIFENLPPMKLGSQPSRPTANPMRETIFENLPPLGRGTRPSRPEANALTEKIYDNLPPLNNQVKLYSAEKMTVKEDDSIIGKNQKSASKLESEVGIELPYSEESGGSNVELIASYLSESDNFDVEFLVSFSSEDEEESMRSNPIFENDGIRLPIISKDDGEGNMYGDDDLQFFPDEKIPRKYENINVSTKPTHKAKVAPKTEIKPEPMRGPIPGTNVTSTFQEFPMKGMPSSDFSKAKAMTEKNDWPKSGTESENTDVKEKSNMQAEIETELNSESQSNMKITSSDPDVTSTVSKGMPSLDLLKVKHMAEKNTHPTKSTTNTKQETKSNEISNANTQSVSSASLNRDGMKRFSPGREALSEFQEFPLSKTSSSNNVKETAKPKVPRQVKVAPKTEMHLQYIPMTRKPPSNDSNTSDTSEKISEPAMKWTNPGRESMSKFQQFPTSKALASNDLKTKMPEQRSTNIKKPLSSSMNEIKLNPSTNQSNNERNDKSKDKVSPITNAYTNASANMVKTSNTHIHGKTDSNLQRVSTPEKPLFSNRNTNSAAESDERPAMTWSSPGKDSTSKFQEFPASEMKKKLKHEKTQETTWSSSGINQNQGKQQPIQKIAEFDHFSKDIPKRERTTKWADEKFSLTPELHEKKPKSFQIDVKVQPEIKLAPKATNIELSVTPEVLKKFTFQSAEAKVSVQPDIRKAPKAVNVQLKLTPQRLKKPMKAAHMEVKLNPGVNQGSGATDATPPKNQFMSKEEMVPAVNENTSIRSTVGKRPTAATVKVQVTLETTLKPYKSAKTNVKLTPDVRVGPRSEDVFLKLTPQVPAPIPIESAKTKMFPAVNENTGIRSTVGKRPTAATVKVQVTPETTRKPNISAKTKVTITPDVRVGPRPEDGFLKLTPQVPAPLPMKSAKAKVKINFVELKSPKDKPRQIGAETNLKLTPLLIKKPERPSKMKKAGKKRDERIEPIGKDAEIKSGTKSKEGLSELGKE